MPIQQFPKNTNVRFSTDVFWRWVPCIGAGMRESTLAKLGSYSESVGVPALVLNFIIILFAFKQQRQKWRPEDGL